MSNEPLIITFFDINGEYNEEKTTDKKKNFLYIESPMRIIEQYINDNFLTNIKEEEKDDNFITKINFDQKLENNFLITVNCDIINNFSVSHPDTFDSNGYIIFCNLENKETFDLLKKIIKYISENCSIFIKTYVIGVFQDHIEEDKNYDKMKEFLKNLNPEIEPEYYEMFIGDKDKFDIIQKNYENSQNFTETFKSIFIDIYRDKIPQLGGKNKTKNIEATSKLMCKIF